MNFFFLDLNVQFKDYMKSNAKSKHFSHFFHSTACVFVFLKAQVLKTLQKKRSVENKILNNNKNKLFQMALSTFIALPSWIFTLQMYESSQFYT